MMRDDSIIKDYEIQHVISYTYSIESLCMNYNTTPL